MLFYPVHQSMGQITITLLFATGLTKLQVSIGIITMLLGILFSYFMLAPDNNIVPGLQLFSIGLAIKMVLMQIFFVNILTFFTARYFNWKFDFLFQIIDPLIILSITWILYFLLDFLTVHFFVKIAIFAPVYISIIAMIIYKFPSLTGFSRSEIFSYIFRK